jgi:hypothetical protein
MKLAGHSKKAQQWSGIAFGISEVVNEFFHLDALGAFVIK